MTNEEEMTNSFARIVLVQLNTDEQLNVREHEAIRVAIKALEQQTSEDAVSRQAVLDIFADNADAVRPYSKTWEKIRDLPSVNPQQKTGHWIVHPKGIYAHLICDNCLSNAPYDCRTNYCPNCGAKMEVEE